ncbi:hypothetical protein M404DRAFT_992845 [Pisolithus tinctorius Marx 270]|uniref:Uncharacterized protein n=1 Tax=Pisolithus tinctorius Marx 270 TaxID=870435 RepID=A0A0C3PH10_PISTI|nr:hypothetical protein M404DRAFT_992845 [Pisolithus tinctorius Marx 270]
MVYRGFSYTGCVRAAFLLREHPPFAVKQTLPYMGCGYSIRQGMANKRLDILSVALLPQPGLVRSPASLNYQ